MNFLNEHWEIIIGGIASLLAFIGGKGKRRYDSLSTMQDTYDKFVENFQEKYIELEADVHKLKEQHSANKKEIDDLNTQIINLRKENSKLVDEVNKWKKLYESLINKK